MTTRRPRDWPGRGGGGLVPYQAPAAGGFADVRRDAAVVIEGVATTAHSFLDAHPILLTGAVIVLALVAVRLLRVLWATLRELCYDMTY